MFPANALRRRKVGRMDELSFPVVEAIKAAGTSPWALVAFALLVAAMTVVSLKVRRNKNLLQNLEKLPEKDRLAALKTEMGTLRIKGGLSPEQWLRHNSRQYLLGGFIVLCVTLVALVSVALQAMPQKAPASGASIRLLQERPAEPAASAIRPSSRAPMSSVVSSVLVHRVGQSERTASQGAVAIDQTPVGTQMAEQAIPPERVIEYQALLERGVQRIVFSAPYLAQLKAGGPVAGFNLLGVPFQWRFPRLSVTVANNTRGVMVLSEARVEVLSAEALNEIIPLFEDLSIGRLVIRNEGWADVVSPRVSLELSDAQRAGEVGLFAPKTVAVDLPSFGERVEIPLEGYLTAALKRSQLLQVVGTLEYGPAGSRRTVQFRTRVSMQVRAAVGMLPSYTYEVKLGVAEGRVVKQVGLAQKIAAGDADHFALRIASDRSARYRLRIDFVTAGGEIIKGQDVSMDIFVPRSPAHVVLAQGR